MSLLLIQNVLMFMKLLRINEAYCDKWFIKVKEFRGKGENEALGGLQIGEGAKYSKTEI